MQLVTKEMIDNYHVEMGEDFIDQTEHLYNGVTLSAFMAGMKPQIAPKLWEKMNEEMDKKSRYSIQQTLEIYEDEFGYEEGTELFYEDFVIAINTTVKSREVALGKLLE